MDEWLIYFNPKCGSCRNALEILKKKNIRPRIVEYLKNPPSIKDLNLLLRKLRVSPAEIIRSKEPIYEELGLSKGAPSRKDFLRAISEHPVLLQRPIVVHGYHAVIARPPEKVSELF
jgi:arsenate reductase